MRITLKKEFERAKKNPLMLQHQGTESRQLTPKEIKVNAYGNQ
jgi:hypothetical protein